MSQLAAGLLMYKKTGNGIKVFLAHPGGPFFTKKDNGFWSIPKGLKEEGEELLETAKREFEEETGIKPVEPFIELGFIKTKGKKMVYCWAFETMEESVFFKSNFFEMEWPPRSGKFVQFPEIDKASFFNIEEAGIKISEAQKPFIERLVRFLEQ